MHKQLRNFALPFSMLLATACGGGDGGTPDAGLPAPDAPSAPDAMVEADGCAPVTVLNTYPANYSGDLAGAGADLDVAAGICADERTHYPQAGEDQVIQLDGLTPGSTYSVKLEGATDMGFYIATDCAGAAITDGQCLLFVDEAEGEFGGNEAGSFVAPASGSALLIVDHYLYDMVPPETVYTYTLTVAEPECTVDADCVGTPATPICSPALECVACADDFDCTEAATPICDPTNACAAATDSLCTEDDANEPNNGPAAATPLVSGVDMVGAVCNSPATESDYYSVVVQDGDSLRINLAWVDNGAADLDMAILNAEGALMGFTLWTNPEVVELSFLPAGTYYIQLTYFGNGDTVTVAHPYTITATVAGAGALACTSTADCAETYNTQLYRGSCDAGGTGACTFIDGAGALAQDVACDSADDCTSGACSYMAFQQTADTSVCTVACANDAECTTAHGAGFSCIVAAGFCHPDCAGDLECGANTGSGTLDTDLPWDYLTCTTGVCDL